MALELAENSKAAPLGLKPVIKTMHLSQR